MLFVLALVAAVGYMFLTKQTIEANITDQVNEYLAQQQTFTHLGVQDSSDAEIKRRLKREWARRRGSKRHDGRLLRPNADCPEPGEVNKQHALGSRHLRRLVPPMDLAGIMIAT